MIYKTEIIGYDLYVNGVLYTGDIPEMMCKIRLACESKSLNQNKDDIR